jgi:hypothetical protein
MVTRERRRAARRQPRSSEALSRVRIRAGRELDVINLSSAGVLVEGEARLLPGRHVDVHVMSATGRTLVRSRVVRAYVSELSSDRVVYRGALAFEHSVQLAAAPLSDFEGNEVPLDNIAPPGDAGNEYPLATT